MVALLRTMGDLGLTTVPGFHDPEARSLLSGPFWRFMVRRAEALARRPHSRDARRWTAQVDGMIVRVAFIDAQIAALKASQVVILGAGLDTRAYRLDALRGATVFEVDHPATQAYKRERAAHLPAPRTKVVYVPVDFAHDSLEKALEASGHDANQPTLWAWEGVIMYLDDAALRSTLRSLRTRSARGSRLVAHYHVESHLPFAALGRKLLFGLLGEAQVGIRSRETMRQELERAGFSVLEDAGVAEQAARVGAPVGAGAVYRVSRMVVAS